MPWICFLKRTLYRSRNSSHEVRYVLGAFAQRRHLERDDVDAIVEVVAELPLLDHLVEIDVGRDHQPELGLDRLCAADPLDLVFLDGAKQLGLQIESEISDLVQKQRASGSQLELAELLSHGAREGASLVSEQVALDQIPRYRREIDGDKRSRRRDPTPDGAAGPGAPCRSRSPLG